MLKSTALDCNKCGKKPCGNKNQLNQNKRLYVNKILVTH